ncbi:hypothetical protein MUY35_02070 [Aliiroseovarius sp. S1339]|uniref:hypothetical protein n=1 Tax=Aliiroseovarius sp. S1339 TaxID=2936990 RepID=UPI0020BFC4C4|nr:hypothetical protein [Aliiroseovarius sp. S1339]MCK8462636.1 hypothetical protein [Aliiroseovarius sp. S1339]
MPHPTHLALCLTALSFGFPAQAENWKTRPNDTRLSASELSDTLTGHTLTYHDGGTSAFEKDGHYTYTYGGGGTWLGEYVIGADSTACVTFVTGISRCDLYIMNGTSLVVITEDGLRFPIQSVTPNEE